MKVSLRNYRADPCNRTYEVIYAKYRVWLIRFAHKTLQKFSVAVDYLDDLVNEGALELSKAPRRYMYMCKFCRRAFLHYSSLRTHALEEHGVRGECRLVKLKDFVEISTTMSMRRVCKNVLKVGSLEVLHEEPQRLDRSASFYSCEDGYFLALLLETARSKLNESAVLLLDSILTGDSANLWKTVGGEVFPADPRVLELWSAFEGLR